MGDLHGDGDKDEKPVRRVRIGQAFAMGKYEVTQGEWLAVMGSNPSHFKDCGDRCPVELVSWDEVQAFIGKLKEKTGKDYRLPSEAEWEYAARGGTSGRFWWGETVGVANANCENCGGMYERMTPLPVGSFKPNPLGLYDMNGGVAEWVADCWNKDYRGAPADGGAWTQGDCRKRVLRGGSWRNDADSLSVTGRFSYDQDVRYLANGFRVARDLN